MMLYFLILLYYNAVCIQYGTSYLIYTVDDPTVCNNSLYLKHGANSAAILKLTSRESYPTTPLYCTISFKVPVHKWSGLTGILEQVDLRRYEDNAHHLGQPFCVDYVVVLTEKTDSVPNEKQCGPWSITPGKPLSRLGYNRALVGYCPHSDALENAEKCHVPVTEIKVIVSIGRDNQEIWRNVTWGPHKGFTFVVTAYSYPIKNGESECRDGLRSCSQANAPGARLGVYHCVHNSFWCDDHVNCGSLKNIDEIACSRKGIWDGLVTVVIGPWMGASMFLLLVFCGVLYWRSSKLRLLRESQSNNQEINSYAESYELSSNLSSAHHMAIQVRVVCNSNHQHHGSRGVLQPWKNDLPPSYETLFPQGPPQPYSPITSITATVAQSTSGSTVSAVGVNVSSTMSLPSTVVTTSGPSSLQPSSETSTVTNTDVSRPPNDITSIIDLNVTSNNFQPSLVARSSDTRSVSSVDATITAANTQTSVTLTLTPSRHMSGDNQCVTTHSNDIPNSQQRRENSELPESPIFPDNDKNITELNSITENDSELQQEQTSPTENSSVKPSDESNYLSGS